MPRSFDEIVADVTSASPAPVPDTPGDAQPVSAAPAIDRGAGAREPAAGDARMGTGPDAGADGGRGAPAPHPPAPTGSVAHPVTGEMIELTAAAAGDLAAMVESYRVTIEAYTAWRHETEDELRRRLGKDKVRVWGNWEVAAVSGRGRKWDTEDLRATVGEFIRDGVLTHQDVADLIVAGEPSVNGAAAARLLGRVPEDRRAALEACFTWQRTGRASVRVTRSADLAGALR